MQTNDLSFNLRSRIERRLAELNISPIQAAQRAGLERTYIRDFLNRKKASIRSDRYEQVARSLDWTVADLLGLDHAHAVIDAMAEELGAPRIIPGDQLVGARDFPIYAAAQGGDGFMIVHTDVMEYVKRPVILEGVPDSYGVLIVGESMIPAYRPGDMALVHPRRPIEREKDVVLYDHDHRTGDAKAMIKHLVSFDDRRLRLQQFNPSKTFYEHRADWPICHQVVGMYKGR